MKKNAIEPVMGERVLLKLEQQIIVNFFKQCSLKTIKMILCGFISAFFKWRKHGALNRTRISTFMHIDGRCFTSAPISPFQQWRFFCLFFRNVLKCM